MHERRINEIDRLIKEKLESGTPAVPKDLWNKIAHELDQYTVRPEPRVSKTVSMRKSKLWISVAATLILAVTAGIVIEDIIDQQKELEYLAPLSQSSPPFPTQAIKVGPEREAAETRLAQNNTSSSAASTSEKLHVVYEEDSTWKGTRRNEENPTNHHAAESLDTESVILDKSVTDTRYRLLSEAEPSPIVNTRDAYLVQMAEVKYIELQSYNQPDDLNKVEGLSMSNLLNFVVSKVDKREEKFIKFSNDPEGSIRIDFNLASNKK